MAKRYLYGAAVQGIQQFIFRSSKLKDIAGASELVEQICTKAFDEFARGESIIRAAGNIKYDFARLEDCERAVLNFPRKVMEMAPGITISQAVVEYDDGTDFGAVVNELERRLRAQRNRSAAPQPGLMAVKRAPRTGLAAVGEMDGELVDEATLRKREMTRSGRQVIELCKKSFNLPDLTYDEVAYEIGDLTGRNDWVAIIHADGNGLGRVVQKLGHNRDKFKDFSRLLDEATHNAAHSAYAAVAGKWNARSKVIPLRPVVLGGDDMTIICQAGIAIDYTKAFIAAFEKETEQLLGGLLSQAQVYSNGNKLTCCAGIAFVKSSYPFHFGYQLAEALCDAAKKDAKAGIAADRLPASCLMFHKVQDSFYVDYSDIVARELTPAEGQSWQFGPYYLDERPNRWTMLDLLRQVEELEALSADDRGVKNQLREWVALKHTNPGLARQRLDRAKTIAGSAARKMLKIATDESKRESISYYAAYDVLSLYSVIYQETK